jgi:16S rRNA (adenine1518-N6/adenine1519-N6)-dimethyltransferase
MAGHKTTLDILKEYNLRPKKYLGQNFLIDDNINRFIVKTLDLSKNDVVLEIGAGLGELVNLIKEKASLIIALEIDNELCNLLRQRFETDKKVEVLNEDILNTDLEQLRKNSGFKQITVLGNLPYYISSAIMFHLVNYRHLIKKALIMLQFEVALRLVAEPGTKDYGILSCLLGYYASKKIIKKIKRNCFLPQPKVDSAVVELSFYKKPLIKVEDEDLFVKVIKTTFGQRRKTIANTLSNLEAEAADKKKILKILNDLGINPAVRPEKLKVEDFGAISDQIAALRK